MLQRVLIELVVEASLPIMMISIYYVSGEGSLFITAVSITCIQHSTAQRVRHA